MAIRHHLVGVLPLTELCDAHKYALLATPDDRRIESTRNHTAGCRRHRLLSSGTRRGASAVACRQILRSGRSLIVCQPQTCFEIWTTRDTVAFNRIDRHNRRRIIRALEVCLLSGKPFSSFSVKTAPDPAIARIVLEQPRAVLITKINRRVDAMFEHGVIAEVAAVEAIGSTAAQAIGFQQIRSLLAGTIDISSCRDAIKQQTRNYAKRQMTWFRRPPV